MNPQPQSHWARRLETTVPYVCPDVVLQVFDGEALLYNPWSGSNHHLNETALRVWRACDGQFATRQVAGQLTEAYHVPFDQALEDVEELLAAFAEAGLLTAREDP